MATLKIEFGNKNSKGERPVRIVLVQGQTKARISTGVTVLASEIGSNGKIKNLAKAKVIAKIQHDYEDRLLELTPELMAINGYDANYLKDRLMVRREQLDFFVFAEEWIKRSTIKGAKNYTTMLNNMERYIGRRVLSFDSITYSFLSGYEAHLKKSVRALSLYLGQIRHLYREAMREYNTDFEQVIKNDPFMRYRVPKQIIKKGVRALTLEQLMAVYNYSGKPCGRAQLARDCFILSFCLMGMNAVDMYNDDMVMKDGRLCYHRTKTRGRRSDEAYIEVRVHPFIEELMRKYQGARRVFDFYMRYSSAADFGRALNIGLKEVGEAIGVPGLQFYQARHTFATLSRNLMRFSKSDVDEALNHVGSYDIADIYITKDFEIINDNNFKLIERVFGLSES